MGDRWRRIASSVRGSGCPSLPRRSTEAEAFLRLIGPNGIGPWQEVE